MCACPNIYTKQNGTTSDTCENREIVGTSTNLEHPVHSLKDAIQVLYMEPHGSENFKTLLLEIAVKGWKLSLFSLYRQRFPRYGPIFKIAVFGYET